MTSSMTKDLTLYRGKPYFVRQNRSFTESTTLGSVRFHFKRPAPALLLCAGITARECILIQHDADLQSCSSDQNNKRERERERPSIRSASSSIYKNNDPISTPSSPLRRDLFSTKLRLCAVDNCYSIIAVALLLPPPIQIDGNGRDLRGKRGGILRAGQRQDGLRL